jgi:hypothetical protein
LRRVELDPLYERHEVTGRRADYVVITGNALASMNTIVPAMWVAVEE